MGQSPDQRAGHLAVREKIAAMLLTGAANKKIIMELRAELGLSRTAVTQWITRIYFGAGVADRYEYMALMMTPKKTGGNNGTETKSRNSCNASRGLAGRVHENTYSAASRNGH